nr:MAG TPA_asm: hypothetical protein [Bacteriophage sp.]
MFVGMGVRIGLLASAAAAAYSPASLFAASEPGVWYDPSDLTTLFQDTAGTTPVTAAGQSVALVLDKSKGLAFGSELASGSWANSGSLPFNSFSSSGSGFNATKSVSGTQQQAYIGSFPVTVGMLYYLEAVVSGNTMTAFFDISTLTTQRSNQFSIPAGSSTVRGYFIPTSTQASANLRVITISASTGSITVSSVTLKQLAGNHATQATAASRPTYQVDGNGKPYLSFDGVDDFLVTPTITPGTDKAQVFAGVRKLSDATNGVIAEHSADWNSNNGSFLFYTGIGNAAGPNYSSSSRGNAAAALGQFAVSAGSFAAPITGVVTATHDIAGDLSAVRVNGAASGTNGTADKGTGNFLAYPAYIGRRGGTTLPFNGRIYSLITRFGANLTAQQISDTETWVNGKTGAY